MTKRIKRESIDRSSELQNCTFVRTILIFAVVLSHSIGFWGNGWLNEVVTPVYSCEWMKALKTVLTNFILYGITIVSGYLFSYLLLEKGKYQQFGPFIWNKFLRLIVPAWFVGLVWIAPFGVKYLGYNGRSIFRNLILAISPGQLWYLWMLMGVFLIFWLLKDFFIRRHLLGCVVCLVIYIGSSILNDYIPSVFQYSRIMQFLLFFWIGFKLRQLGTGIFRKNALLLVILYVLLLLTKKLELPISGIILRLYRKGLQLIRHIVGGVTIFTVLQELGDRIPWQNSKVFRLFSEHSMGIFLFHQQILYVTLTELNGVLKPELHALVNFVLAFGISLLISVILHKWRITRFLIGEKT